MSNGPACCILGVCCPPPPEGQNEDQIKALAKFLDDQAKRSLDTPRTEQFPTLRSRQERVWLEVAEAVFANFDLVPRGVGRAIVEAYRPEFERHHGTGTASARRNFVGEAAPGGAASPIVPGGKA